MGVYTKREREIKIEKSKKYMYIKMYIEKSQGVPRTFQQLVYFVFFFFFLNMSADCARKRLVTTTEVTFYSAYQIHSLDTLQTLMFPPYMRSFRID